MQEINCGKEVPESGIPLFLGPASSKAEHIFTVNTDSKNIYNMHIYTANRTDQTLATHKQDQYQWPQLVLLSGTSG